MAFQPKRITLPTTESTSRQAWPTSRLFFEVPNTNLFTATQTADFAYRIIGAQLIKGGSNGAGGDQITLLNNGVIVGLVDAAVNAGIVKPITSILQTANELRKGDILSIDTDKVTDCSGLLCIEIVPIH